MCDDADLGQGVGDVVGGGSDLFDSCDVEQDSYDLLSSDQVCVILVFLNMMCCGYVGAG